MKATMAALQRFYDAHPNVILMCSNCGEEYSADPADNWQLSPTDPQVLTCECGSDLVVATKQVILTEIEE